MSSRILLVDDLPANIELLDAILSKKNYLTQSAFSGAEALQKIPEFQPQVALVDVMMPGMNGYELCRTIRRDYNQSYVPVIFITASEVTHKDIVEGFDAGGDDYVCKPFDAQILLSRIAACLRVKALQDNLTAAQAELGRYVSRPTLQMVAGKMNGEKHTDSRKANVTILFSDLRDFTHRTAHLEPEQVFKLLNDSLVFQLDLIEKHGGTIDKLSGDEIMAIFEGPQMAERAIACAREIVQARQDALCSEPAVLPRLGIGINTGPVYLGSVGKPGALLDYTAVGAPVNIAARLCGMAGNAQVLISQHTLDAVSATLPDVRSIGSKPLKGLTEPLEVFELVTSH